MQRTLVISSVRWTTAIVLAALCFVPSACDRSPKVATDDAPELAAQRAATQPTSPPKSNIELGDPLPSMKARAEAGDVGAMVSLGRAYEVLGSKANREEARKWYKKAADKGDSSARESLAMMDAADRATTTPSDAPLLNVPKPAVAASQPSKPGSPTTTTVASTAPMDPDKVRWQEILGCFDNADFATQTQPNFRQPGGGAPMFIGLTASPDRTLTIAVSGANADVLDAVSMVLRLRNRQNVADNLRVQQASSVVGTITRGNVARTEVADWVSKYLLSGLKSEPVFRNGWRITISGTSGEGIKDPKAYLGEAVLIEMKK